MILVIAGDYRQYLNYLETRNISKSGAKYVIREQDLVGYKNPKIVLWGTYWKNPVYNSKEYLLLKQNESEED